jgi:hypothetical protein
MFDGLVTEYVSQWEEEYRRAVVYPRATRRAQHEADLRLLRQAGAGLPRPASPVRRLVARLAGIGAQPSSSQVAPGA